MYADVKGAFLVENGFCEREYIEMQDIFAKMEIPSRIISSDAKLLTAWNKLDDPRDSHWGMKYAADYHLKNAQSHNFDILVIPGGRRSAEKLKLDHSVKSFITGFLSAGKPVVVYNLGHEVLFHYDLIRNYYISKYSEKGEFLQDGKSAGVRDGDIILSKNLISMSGFNHDERLIENYIDSILSGNLADYDPAPVKNKAA